MGAYKDLTACIGANKVSNVGIGYSHIIGILGLVSHMYYCIIFKHYNFIVFGSVRTEKVNSERL